MAAASGESALADGVLARLRLDGGLRRGLIRGASAALAVAAVAAQGSPVAAVDGAARHSTGVRGRLCPCRVDGVVLSALARLRHRGACAGDALRCRPVRLLGCGAFPGGPWRTLLAMTWGCQGARLGFFWSRRLLSSSMLSGRWRRRAVWRLRRWRRFALCGGRATSLGISMALPCGGDLHRRLIGLLRSGSRMPSMCVCAGLWRRRVLVTPRRCWRLRCLSVTRSQRLGTRRVGRAFCCSTLAWRQRRRRRRASAPRPPVRRLVLPSPISWRHLTDGASWQSRAGTERGSLMRPRLRPMRRISLVLRCSPSTRGMSSSCCVRCTSAMTFLRICCRLRLSLCPGGHLGGHTLGNLWRWAMTGYVSLIRLVYLWGPTVFRCAGVFL